MREGSRVANSYTAERLKYFQFHIHFSCVVHVWAEFPCSQIGQPSIYSVFMCICPTIASNKKQQHYQSKGEEKWQQWLQKGESRRCNCQSICKFYGGWLWPGLLTVWPTGFRISNEIYFIELTFRIRFLPSRFTKERNREKKSPQKTWAWALHFHFHRNSLVISRFFKHNEFMFSASIYSSFVVCFLYFAPLKYEHEHGHEHAFRL